MPGSDSNARADSSGSGHAAFPSGLLEELRRLARQKLGRLPPGQTLQATALVNEVYLRLADEAGAERSPDEFLRCAARAMQDVLVENARKKASLRGGGSWRRTKDVELSAPSAASPEDLLSLNEALERFAGCEPRKAELVRLRFFAGLSEAECAEVFKISERTVRREWRFSRAWLLAALEDAVEESDR